MKFYLLIISGILFFGIVQTASSQSSAITFRMRVSDNAQVADSGWYVFGNHPNATYGVNQSLGENASPPDPPGFYSKWVNIPGRNISTYSSTGLLDKDLRGMPPYISSPQKDTFFLKVKNDNASAANADLTISWPNATYLFNRCDSMFFLFTDNSLTDDPTGATGSGIPAFSGTTAKVDMFAQSSVVIKRPFDLSGFPVDGGTQWNAAAPAITLKIYKFGIKNWICECLESTTSYTNSASTITSTSAALNGYIHFGCDPIDSAAFQYGTTTSYGTEIHASVSSSSSDGSFYTATVTNLIPNTTYHYRTTAYLRSYCSGEQGKDYGADQTFTTDPPSSIFWMKVDDTANGHDSLVFGSHVYATCQIDESLGEIYYGPVPPPGDFHAYWFVCPTLRQGSEITHKDLRSPADTDTFHLSVHNSSVGAETASLTLHWPDSTYLRARTDSMFLKFFDLTAGSGSGIPGDSVNMLSTNTITIKTPYDASGWNLAAPTITLKLYKYGTKLPLVDAVRKETRHVPTTFALHQNYPNPFNPVTTLSFDISHLSFVSLKIYAVLGREVAALVNEELAPGTYTRTWDASGVPSGVYFYRMTAGRFVATKKLIFIR